MSKETTVSIVAPAPGVGVTLHSRDGLVPGTIFRAGPRIFWFRLDPDFEGAAQLSEAMRRWTYRAILQRDGGWREGDCMWRVEVGIRRARVGPAPEPVDEVERLAAAVEAIEPPLLRRRWYPMTYLAIPGVLARANELLARLAVYSGLEVDRVAALLDRLRALRTGFRNVGGGLASASDGPES